MAELTEEKVLVSNRRARHEYFLIQTYEAGLVLQGTEVKSLRQGKGNLTDSYASLRDSEIWLVNSQISEYKEGNINNHDPYRERKLLLNKSEIRKIRYKMEEKGMTLVPLSLYLKGGKVKVELALARGKKMYDKRETIAKRDFQRDQERRIKY
jgi:SsrA-binding protein